MTREFKSYRLMTWLAYVTMRIYELQDQVECIREAQMPHGRM